MDKIKSREDGIKRAMLRYIRRLHFTEEELNEVVPWLVVLLKDTSREMTIDEMIEAWDFLGCEVAVFPRDSSKMFNWFSITELPRKTLTGTDELNGKDSTYRDVISMRRKEGWETRRQNESKRAGTAEVDKQAD